MFDLLQVLLADLHSVDVVFGIDVQLISDVVLSFVEKPACMFVLAFRNHGLFVFLLKLLFAGFYLGRVSFDLPLFQQVDHPLGVHVFETDGGDSIGLISCHNFF